MVKHRYDSRLTAKFKQYVIFIYSQTCEKYNFMSGIEHQTYLNFIQSHTDQELNFMSSGPNQTYLALLHICTAVKFDFMSTMPRQTNITFIHSRAAVKVNFMSSIPRQTYQNCFPNFKIMTSELEVSPTTLKKGQWCVDNILFHQLFDSFVGWDSFLLFSTALQNSASPLLSGPSGVLPLTNNIGLFPCTSGT